MKKTVLVPVDGSKFADAALEAAEDLAGSTGARLTLWAAS